MMSEIIALKYIRQGIVENGYGKQGVILDDDIFSVSKEDDKIIIREECDGYHQKTCSKEQAIDLFEEIINWIKAA